MANPSPTDDVQSQVNAIRAMVQQSGAPPTAENWNRASLHIAQNNGIGPVLFEQAMARQAAVPTQRQAMQAATQTRPASEQVRLGAGTEQVAPAEAAHIAGIRNAAMQPPVQDVDAEQQGAAAATASPPPPAASPQMGTGPRTGDVRIDQFGQPVADSQGSFNPTAVVLPALAAMIAGRAGPATARKLGEAQAALPALPAPALRIAGPDTSLPRSVANPPSVIHGDAPVVNIPGTDIAVSPYTAGGSPIADILLQRGGPGGRHTTFDTRGGTRSYDDAVDARRRANQPRRAEK